MGHFFISFRRIYFVSGELYFAANNLKKNTQSSAINSSCGFKLDKAVQLGPLFVSSSILTALWSGQVLSISMERVGNFRLVKK